MKKICSIFLCAAAVLLSACQDTAEVRSAAGGYTYKTSGVVTITKADTVMEVHLTPETGMMTLASNKNGKEATLSFNHNGGDSYDMVATIDKDSIYLMPGSRFIDVAVAQDTLLFGNVNKRRESFEIEVTGDGKVMSNGDVCLNLHYEGDALNDGYHLEGNEVHVHAKRVKN